MPLDGDDLIPCSSRNYIIPGIGDVYSDGGESDRSAGSDGKNDDSITVGMDSAALDCAVCFEPLDLTPFQVQILEKLTDHMQFFFFRRTIIVLFLSVLHTHTVCVRACVHACLDIYIYVCACERVYICLCVRAYVCICVRVCTYVRTYIYTYIRTYVHVCVCVRAHSYTRKEQQRRRLKHH